MAKLYPTSIANYPDVPESEKQVFEKLADVIPIKRKKVS